MSSGLITGQGIVGVAWVAWLGSWAGDGGCTCGVCFLVGLGVAVYLGSLAFYLDWGLWVCLGSMG